MKADTDGTWHSFDILNILENLILSYQCVLKLNCSDYHYIKLQFSIYNSACANAYSAAVKIVVLINKSNKRLQLENYNYNIEIEFLIKWGKKLSKPFQQ